MYHRRGDITDWNDPVQLETFDVNGLNDLDQDDPADMTTVDETTAAYDGVRRLARLARRTRRCASAPGAASATVAADGSLVVEIAAQGASVLTAR